MSDLSKEMLSKTFEMKVHEIEIHSPESGSSTMEKEGSHGDTTEQAPIPLTGGQFWLVLGVMALSLTSCGIDLNVLGDASIVIALHFNSLDRLVWLSATTFMVAAATMLIWGRIYSHFEAKYLIMAALLVMTTGELLAGLATNFNMFICGRTLTGLALSNIMVATMTVTGLVTTGIQRPLFVSLVTGCFGLTIKVGPFISGGLLKRSDSLWRWCFFLQLPLLGVIFLVTTVFFPKLGRLTKSDDSASSINTSGRQQSQLRRHLTLVLTGCLQGASIVCLIFPLLAGTSQPQYAWAAWRMIICYVLCPTLGAVFMFLELRAVEDERYLPIAALQQDRTVICMGIITFCSCMLIFPGVFYLPLVFQIVFGSSPIRAAVQMLPNALLGTIACVAAGKIAEITGYFTPTCIFLSMIDIVGCGIILTLKSTDHLWKVYLFTSILGISAGGLSSLGTPVITERVPIRRFGTASAFINLCIIFGAAVGVAGASVIFNKKVVSLVRDIIVHDPSMASVLASSGSGTAAIWNDLIYIVAASSDQAKTEFRAGFMQAFTHAHLFFMVAGILSLFASLICPQKKMLSHSRRAQKCEDQLRES